VIKSTLFKKNCLIISIMLVFAFTGICMAFAETTKKIAVIPFKINSAKDITYIKSGVFAMVYSRLSWKDKIQVMDKNNIQPIIQELSDLPENKFVTEIGKQTKADYVLTGSITEFADAYSFDIKVFNIKKKTYLIFYDQAGQIGEIIKTLDVITAKINRKVFNRTTLAYERLEKEKIINKEDLKRMNPEHMLPYRQSLDEKGKDNPWWKFW